MKNILLLPGILVFLLLFSVCQTPKSGSQLIWQSKSYALYRDSVVQAPFVARALSATELVSDYKSMSRASPDSPPPASVSRWEMSRQAAAFPQYQSDYPLVDALYNLSLEEMMQAVGPDSTFRSGPAGSRAISYSLILSMAALQPRVSRNSLMRQVKNGRIVQDAGSSGAYPVSADRMVWALAAWELYRVSGDQRWLRQAYPIIRDTMEDDLKNSYNLQSGLFRGGPSFPDRREQAYPAWMEPVDIYESECLETNVIFYQANEILSAMAALLQDMPAAAKYHQLAVSIRHGINDQLWLPEKGYYGQYRYGRNFKSLSPRAEALGEALAILFGITDIGRQKSLVEKTPVTAFGIPGIYPLLPDIAPGHNAGIQPFVQAYWSLAAAKAGHEMALMESMSALYRPAALLLANQEYLLALNGDAAGTGVNAGARLSSLAGNLSLIYKVIYGMDFQPQRLVFRPVVPRAFKGHRQLSNFPYRQALLDIHLTGYGNQVKSITLDDKPLPQAAVPANLQGRHVVKIVLANQELAAGFRDNTAPRINKPALAFSPKIPVVTYTAGTLAWEQVAGAVRYKVLKNGRPLLSTQVLQVKVPPREYGEYQVIAVDTAGHESFANEPVIVAAGQVRQLYELETLAAPATLPYTGFSGTGFVAHSKQANTRLRLPVSVPQTGWYAIDFRYANGAGPIPGSHTCALRSLRLGSNRIGTIVLPPRGTGQWSEWGFTNALQVRLTEGSHILSLTLEPGQENMGGEGDEVLLDYMRLTRIKEETGKSSN